MSNLGICFGCGDKVRHDHAREAEAGAYSTPAVFHPRCLLSYREGEKAQGIRHTQGVMA